MRQKSSLASVTMPFGVGPGDDGMSTLSREFVVGDGQIDLHGE